MDPKQLRKRIRRWTIPVVAITVMGGLLAFALSKRITPEYTATATVLVQAAPNQAASNTGVALNAGEVTTTAASQLTELPLLQRVIDELQLHTTPEDLIRRVTATPEVNSELVDVSTTEPRPALAAGIANQLALDYVRQVTQANQQRVNQAGAALQAQIAALNNTLQQEADQLAAARGQDTTGIHAQIAANESLLATLTQNYATFQATQAQNLENVSVSAAATEPSTPSSPKTAPNVGMGVAAGLLIALAFAALVEYFDRGLHTPDDIQERLGVPCLGVIPKFDARIRSRRQRDVEHAQEAYRRLRTNLLFSALDVPLRSIAVTSVRPGEGKTRTAANLAVALASSEKSVLLVDADFRRPAQHRMFDKPLAEGMSELLRSAPNGVPRLNGMHATGYQNLAVLTCGVIPPNPSELLASSRSEVVIRGLEAVRDIVVIDTPPAPAVTDALSVASHTSGAVVVIEAGKTNADQARMLIDALRGVRAKVLGVVLNKAHPRKLGYYNQYYYEAGPKQGRLAGSAELPSFPPPDGDQRDATAPPAPAPFPSASPPR